MTLAAPSTSACPECDGPVTPDGGDAVCSACGLVVDENRIDHGREWRSCTADDPQRGDPRRTGAQRTVTLHDRGLSTNVGNYADLQKLPPRKRRRIVRLRKQQNRTQIRGRRERNEVYGLSEVRRIASDVGLPQAVRERASKLYSDAQAEDLFPGRDLDGMTAAAVYAAARLSDVPRTIEGVADAARNDADRVRMCFTALNRGLDLPLSPPQPAEYLPQYASWLDLPPAVEAAARRLLDVLDEQHIVGKNPSGIAAAALYTAARDTEHDVTQAVAADVADVSVVTLRETYQTLAGGELVEETA